MSKRKTSQNLNLVPFSTVPVWLRARFALSKHAAQFTLPVDIRKLQTLTPLDYVRQYCKVSNKRTIIYQQIFNQNKTGFTETCLSYTELLAALRIVFSNELSPTDVDKIVVTFGLNSNTKYDLTTFCGIAAYTERLFYKKFTTPETEDYIEFQKDVVESADFFALDRKLIGITISAELSDLLHSL